MQNNPIHIEAPQEWRFLTCDGKEIKTIAELATTISTMDKQAFQHHVNEERNDFAIWVKKVFGDRRLARDLSRSKTIKTSVKKIEAYLQQNN